MGFGSAVVCGALWYLSLQNTKKVVIQSAYQQQQIDSLKGVIANQHEEQALLQELESGEVGSKIKKGSAHAQK